MSLGLGCSLVGRVFDNMHEALDSILVSHKASMVAHTRKPHSLEMETRELKDQGHPWVYSELDVTGLQ